MRFIIATLGTAVLLSAVTSGCAVITAEEKARIETRLKEVENRQATVEDQAEARRQRYQDRFEDLEQAIGELRTAINDSEGGEQTRARLDALEKKIGKLRQDPADTAEVTKTEGEQSAPPTEFEQAQALLDNGKFIEARELLQRLEHSELPPEVASLITLLIGESYYREKDYHQAILSFHKVVEAEPATPETPQAMLREAQCFGLLGKSDNAVFLFKKLLSEYPDSEQADEVRTELEKLQ